MAGTITGGKAASQTIKELYGEDHYKRIGKIGGLKGKTGGFYYAKHNLPEDHPAHPKNAGKIGGKLNKK
jgi:hypothetical protein